MTSASGGRRHAVQLYLFEYVPGLSNAVSLIGVSEGYECKPCIRPPRYEKGKVSGQPAVVYIRVKLDHPSISEEVR